MTSLTPAQWQEALDQAAVFLMKAVGGVEVGLDDPRQHSFGQGYVGRLASIEDNLQAILALGQEHFSEVEEPRDNSALFAPNYADYIRRQKAGNLVNFMLFFNEVPVGYMMMEIGKSRIHGKLIAQEDIFFIAKEHRRGFLGFQFMRYAHSVLHDLGVHEVSAGFKTTKNLGMLYKRAGFTHAAEFYTKVL